MFAASRHLEVVDANKGISFSALVLYPTTEPSTSVAFGPYTMEVSPDAAAAAGTFPLVVVSHGNGGSHLLYRSIATHLATHGYVVALLEHHGNNRSNNTMAGTYENLVNRPRHVRILIDSIERDPQLGRSVQPDSVAIIGHSIGGYTALAVAGGVPWSDTWGQVEVAADARVKALVLLAPVTTWYRADNSLQNLSVPILMLIAEHDGFTACGQAELLLDRVPDRKQVILRVIENAGHFAFLTPFPAHMRNPKFYPSMDPEGFDRENFHQKLPGEIRAFLDDKLKKLLPL